MFSKNIKKNRDRLLLIFLAVYCFVFNFDIDSVGLASALSCSWIIDLLYTEI